ncbi:tannase/feruloyl esterase family alpha/beta hydrolase [Tolumonas lignilytica]|uniref:tannase/feruloyl esterase family alpha/beta hydrolase n=1 Tax=Tolumonas lignilytica TaxID=1283284 RepID=UPI0004B210B5|nr:tannase/feruloyl esterase family alpha/beta hydrolase [Tolumonas lignilytica]
MKQQPRKVIKQRGQLCLITLVSLASSPYAFADKIEACSQLKNLTIDNGSITETRYVNAGLSQQDPFRMFTGASEANHELPAHCLVRGEIDKRVGSDGKNYSIRFEVRLPESWQNRFIFQGGGGTDGFLANAIGTAPFLGSTAAPALARGYAVTSMNGGHDSVDATFGLDQKARLDYAYAAIGKVTQAAKSVTRSYYKDPLKYSYFMGCSNGGREAMIASQRYPTEFDGVVAGNPGFRLSKAGLGEIWDTQQLSRIAPKNAQGRKILANALSDADLKLISDSVLEKCDALDGLKDGIINNYMQCSFDPKVLQCNVKNSKNCLSAQKVTAVKAIFDGAKDSKGNKIYSSWPYDAGINTPGWRIWKLGFSQDPNKPDSLNATLGAESMKYYFMTPSRPDADLNKFDFDNDVQSVLETGALNDAASTMMTTFATRGGKLMIIQGVSDPVFSAHDIRDWYQATEANTSHGDQSAMKSWNRLFMVPGMAHCGGGVGLDDLDPLTAIQNWVENQQAPDFIAAKGKAFPGKTQPVCSYPAIAKYKGSGDINSIDSYHCE